MTYDIKALRVLEKRLAEAKEPSKHLSRDIQCQIGGWYRRTPSEGGTKHPTFIHPDDVRDGAPVFCQLHGTSVYRDTPDVTASLDAAVALVDRVLPVSFPTIDRYQHSDKAEHASFNWRAWIKWVTPDDHLHEAFSGTKETPALALCLACVRALIAQEVAA